MDCRITFRVVNCKYRADGGPGWGLSWMCMNTQVNIGALSLLSRFQEGVASYPVRRVLRSGRGKVG